MRLRDKVAIVTGAASGIGLAIATRFAHEGAKVVLADLDYAKANAAAAQLPSGAIAVICDVSSESDVEKACAIAEEKFGALEIVVNNAGLMTLKPMDELTGADWTQVLGVDLLGAFYFTKQLFVRPAKAAIVNIASVHAIETTANVAPYAAAKAALLSLTRSTSIEGKPKGIRANAILPGAIDTPMLWTNPNLKSGAEVLDKSDVGKPEDIAAAAVFLASDEAKFVTGVALNVDGGRLAHL